MANSSHNSLNTEAHRESKAILERVRKGKYLFGRVGESFEFVKRAKMDLPEYVEREWQGKERFVAGWLRGRKTMEGL